MNKIGIVTIVLSSILSLSSYGKSDLIIAPSFKQPKKSYYDASLRGFSLDDQWNYVNDVDKEQLSLDGSRYHYGYMDSWMGIYKFYNSPSNEMFVLLLSSAESKPRKDSYWDQRRWNNRLIKSEFSCSNSSVHYLNYAPKATMGTISTSTSISLGAGMQGDDAVLTTTVTYSESYSSTEVSVTAEGSSESQVAVKFSFLRYSSNTSLSNIHCSNVDRQSYAIYKITNYNPSNSYNFTIKNYVSIYRYGVFNSATVTEHQEQTFTI